MAASVSPDPLAAINLKNLLFITLSTFLLPFHSDKKNVPQENNIVKLGIRLSCKTISSYCPDNLITATVTIYNGTDTLISIFDPQYLWGYFNTSFLVTGNDTAYSLYPKDRDFDKNIPSYTTLFPGDSMIVAKDVLLFSNYTWNPSPPYVLIRNIKSIRAIYQYALDTASLEGVATINDSIKYKYEFHSSAPGNYRRSRKNGNWQKIDSIATPIPTRRTFLLDKLESETIKFE